MAALRLAKAAIIPVTNKLPLTPPPDAYAPKITFTEADLEMQRTSGFRNRQRQGPTNLNLEDSGSATQSEDPRTPTSKDEYPECQGIKSLLT